MGIRVKVLRNLGSCTPWAMPNRILDDVDEAWAEKYLNMTPPVLMRMPPTGGPQVVPKPAQGGKRGRPKSKSGSQDQNDNTTASDDSRSERTVSDQ